MTDEKNKTILIALDPKQLLGHLHAGIIEQKKAIYLRLQVNEEKVNEDDPDYTNDSSAVWIE